ncbi:cytochrome C [Pyxidicoccus xibeiensis]|uniref:cytochrome C n=1 Tax=Pyxidicoccus xibeiensis TaxID=2906759 RepID=UPI0020A7AACB|nr:cytochrome C [Pyxidicoccus xibeiensis]MCP3138823.1 cytochrome C [Pyxidicoccus xibeiensis]
MRHLRMGPGWVAGVAWLAVMGGVALGCGSQGAPVRTGDDEQAQVPVGTEDRERIERGLILSPVPLNLTGLDRDLVGLGSYLVNATSGCSDCHTNPPYLPGGDPFLGEPEQTNSANFLAGGRPFGPGIVSPNLTPGAEGLPAGLTYEAFVALMRTGRTPGGRILQVMPWPVFSKMRDADLRAIYEYLRAIPPAQPGTTPPPTPGPGPGPYP